MGARAAEYDPTLLRTFVLLIGQSSATADVAPRPTALHSADELRDIARALRSA